MRVELTATHRASIVAVGLFALVGVLLRLWEFGVYGFWNDEAWVALSTRVAGYAQFRLALSTTPVAWGLLLQPFAALPYPEIALRVPALAFSCLTLWFAWKLGCRLADHPLGGVFAVALVALDPVAIQYAKQLKQYSAETAVMLGTLWLMSLLASGDAKLSSLTAALIGGLALSNAQILTAPAVLAALMVGSGAHATVGRTRLIKTTALVGACCLTYFWFVLRPSGNDAMHTYWTSYYLPVTDVGDTAARAVGAFRAVLAPGLGPYPIWSSIISLALLMMATDARPIVIAVVLVVGEMVFLAMFELLPIGVARTSLFLTNAILVIVGAAAARGSLLLWRHRRLRLAAPVAVAALAALVFHGRPWATMANVAEPEDVGPLMQTVEAARGEDDRVLLYSQSPYVWSYYQEGTPVLQPFASVSVGFFPVFQDADLAIVDGRTIREAVGEAIEAGKKVWFVGSRFHGSDEADIVTEVASRMHVVDEQRRSNALLLQAIPRSTVAGPAERPGSGG